MLYHLEDIIAWCLTENNQGGSFSEKVWNPSLKDNPLTGDLSGGVCVYWQNDHLWRTKLRNFPQFQQRIFMDYSCADFEIVLP